jgi:heat shock protein HslJ
MSIYHLITFIFILFFLTSCSTKETGKEKRVHGNAGCNTINGKVEVDGSNITFSEIITTEMACPGNLEQRFLTALQSVDSYKLEKLRLFLYEDEEERLVFRKID